MNDPVGKAKTKANNALDFPVADIPGYKSKLN